MSRPCTCDRVRKGEPYTPDQCAKCWVFHDPSPESAAHRRNWKVERPEDKQLDCPYLGAYTGKTKDCGG